MDLRIAPVGTSGNPTTGAIVVRARARCRGACWVVIRDLAWADWIADVEYANSRIEVTACERCCLVDVVHAAGMAAVGKRSQPGEVRQDLVAVRRIVHLQHDLRDYLGFGLIVDVDDPCQRERRQARGARGSELCRA